VGRLLPFADDPSWGRAFETEAGTEVYAGRDRFERSRVVAPPRRTFELSWTDGTDERAMRGADPDWATIDADAGRVGVANYGDPHGDFDGIVREVDGEHRPCLYLPRVARLAGGAARSVVLNRRDQLALVRIASTVRVDTVLGEELSDEVVRVATVALREVV
jgi:hypothetical protein